MFRLLQAIDTEDLTQGIHRHFAYDQAGKVTMRGLREWRRMGWTHGLRSPPWLPELPRETPPSLPAS
jgi:hypothetical protein